MDLILSDPELDEIQNQDNDVEHHHGGRRHTVVKLIIKFLVDVIDHGQAAVQRSGALAEQSIDLIEGLEGVDEGDDAHKKIVGDSSGSVTRRTR